MYGFFELFGRVWIMHCLMDHIVLNVEDDEKMIDFYTNVLMFKPERLSQYRAGEVPFASVRLNSNTIIDLFPKTIWEKSARKGDGRENLNHFCIALGKETLVKALGATSGRQIFLSKKALSLAGGRTEPEHPSISETLKET